MDAAETDPRRRVNLLYETCCLHGVQEAKGENTDPNQIRLGLTNLPREFVVADIVGPAIDESRALARHFLEVGRDVQDSQLWVVAAFSLAIGLRHRGLDRERVG